MAGNWIKMECCTPEKAEVLALTARLGWDDADLTVGKLFRLWRWFDQQTENGNARGVTAPLLDRVVGVTGFCEAASAVGWMVITPDGIALPNFGFHNGETAKARALGAKRTAKSKAKEAANPGKAGPGKGAAKGNGKGNAKGDGKGNAHGVTPTSPKEEKNREEGIEPNGSIPPSPPGLDVEAWERFASYRSKTGNPIKPASLEAAQKALADYGAEQQAVVAQSVANGWRGLFPIKHAQQQGYAAGPVNRHKGAGAAIFEDATHV